MTAVDDLRFLAEVADEIAEHGVHVLSNWRPSSKRGARVFGALWSLSLELSEAKRKLEQQTERHKQIEKGLRDDIEWMTDKLLEICADSRLVASLLEATSSEG